jgi:hypothetical protein
MDRRDAPTARKAPRRGPVRRIQTELPLNVEPVEINPPPERPRWQSRLELVVVSVIAAAMWFAMGCWLWANLLSTRH